MIEVISERAIFARINRKLARTKNESLHACREDSRSFPTLGRFYIIDNYTNIIVNYGINDLNDLAQELDINATTA